MNETQIILFNLLSTISFLVLLIYPEVTAIFSCLFIIKRLFFIFFMQDVPNFHYILHTIRMIQ